MKDLRDQHNVKSFFVGAVPSGKKFACGCSSTTFFFILLYYSQA